MREGWGVEGVQEVRGEGVKRDGRTRMTEFKNLENWFSVF